MPTEKHVHNITSHTGLRSLPASKLVL